MVKQGRFYEIKGRLQKCTMLIFFHLISLRFTLFLGTVSGLGTEKGERQGLSPFFVEQTCLKIAYLMDESKNRYPLRYSSAFFLRRFWYVRRTTSTLA